MSYGDFWNEKTEQRRRSQHRAVLEVKNRLSEEYAESIGILNKPLGMYTEGSIVPVESRSFMGKLFNPRF
jgi:hypothetical protein